jgi:hypothetical protein
MADSVPMTIPPPPSVVCLPDGRVVSVNSMDYALALCQNVHQTQQMANYHLQNQVRDLQNQVRDLQAQLAAATLAQSQHLANHDRSVDHSLSAPSAAEQQVAHGVSDELADATPIDPAMEKLQQENNRLREEMAKLSTPFQVKTAIADATKGLWTQEQLDDAVAVAVAAATKGMTPNEDVATLKNNIQMLKSEMRGVETRERFQRKCADELQKEMQTANDEQAMERKERENLESEMKRMKKRLETEIKLREKRDADVRRLQEAEKNIKKELEKTEDKHTKEYNKREQLEIEMKRMELETKRVHMNYQALQQSIRSQEAMQRRLYKETLPSRPTEGSVTEQEDDGGAFMLATVEALKLQVQQLTDGKKVRQGLIRALRQDAQAQHDEIQKLKLKCNGLMSKMNAVIARAAVAYLSVRPMTNKILGPSLTKNPTIMEIVSRVMQCMHQFAGLITKTFPADNVMDRLITLPNGQVFSVTGLTFLVNSTWEQIMHHTTAEMQLRAGGDSGGVPVDSDDAKALADESKMFTLMAENEDGKFGLSAAERMDPANRGFVLPSKQPPKKKLTPKKGKKKKKPLSRKKEQAKKDALKLKDRQETAKRYGEAQSAQLVLAAMSAHAMQPNPVIKMLVDMPVKDPNDAGSKAISHELVSPIPSDVEDEERENGNDDDEDTIDDGDIDEETLKQLFEAAFEDGKVVDIDPHEVLQKAQPAAVEQEGSVIGQEDEDDEQ